jgi:hypothetical protein
MLSHFSCPLCGKNSSIAKYDPDSLDFDLKTVSYSSGGRGRIHQDEKSSILGQKDPIEAELAERTLKILKMFLDSGSLTLDKILAGLEVPIVDHVKPVIRKVPVYSGQWERAELDKLRKEMENEQSIRRTLQELRKFLDSEFYLSDDYELKLRIHKKPEGKGNLLLLNVPKKVDGKNILKRLSSFDAEVVSFLDFLALVLEEESFAKKMTKLDFTSSK